MTGASGMLGRAIRSAMSARQMQSLQLSRSTTVPRPQQDPRPPGKDHAGNDLRTLQYVAVSISGEVPWNPTANPPIAHPELLEGLSAAIHLCGANLAAHRWTPAYKREIVSSRVDSTRVLATALAALKHPPQALFVASGSGIYGNRGDELLDESSTLGSGFLADLCRQWEDAAKPAVDAGIRVVHLRMGIVLGPDPGSILSRLKPIFRLGLGGRLGAGTQWMSWISLTDLIAAIFFLFDHPEIAGPVNLTAPNPITNAQFARALGRQLHRPAAFPVPAAALRLM
ncbi:MAG: TIGR01777 family oxidoreductase, partial [Terracidiphilus sp.]